ncbi:MAG: mannosyltransferase family protein, partial [bacterium]
MLQPPDSCSPNSTIHRLKTVLLLFVATRILVFAAATVINTHLAEPLAETSPVWHGSTVREGALLEPWRRWDALWFLNVAREGYSYRPDAQSNVTVFPFYPLAIHLAGAALGNDVLAGVLISNLCLLLLTFLLYDLAREEGGDAAAVGTLLFLYSFPTAFLLTGVYSESLFTMLCVAAFWFARRGRWLPCGAAAMLAGATRLVGLLILPALAAEYLSQRRWKTRECRAVILFLLIVPLGLLLHFACLYNLTGDFFAYFEAQHRWGHKLASPFFSVAYELGGVRTFSTYLSLSISALFLLAGYAALRGIRASYGLFALGIVLAAMSATTLNGVPRYVLVAFPAFMALG